MQNSEICCACLQNGPPLTNIEQTDVDNVKLIDKLNSCVPDVPWNEENLVCNACLRQLRVATAFRELCLQSYAVRLVPLHVEEVVKAEDITIEEDPMLKLEDHIHPTMPVECSAVNFSGDNDASTSCLRNLLEAPQEFLKNKYYLLNKDYSQYLKINSKQASTTKICESNNETATANKSCLREILETGKAPTDNNDNEDNTIEIVEDAVESNMSDKSLLRDLLLQPTESPNNKIITNEDNPQIERLNSQPRARRFDQLKYYYCKHCGIKFKDRSALCRHNIDFHQRYRPWDCMYCDKTFRTKSNLKEHELSHSYQRKYLCNVCYRFYDTTSKLTQHKIIKHKPPQEWRYMCQYCGERYPFKAYREQHIKKYHVNVVMSEMTCFHCNEKFFSKLLLIEHMESKHALNMNRCSICQFTCITQTEFENHIIGEHFNRPLAKMKKYKCDKCCRLYTTLKAKQIHYIKCDGLKWHLRKKYE